MNNLMAGNDNHLIINNVKKSFYHVIEKATKKAWILNYH